MLDVADPAERAKAAEALVRSGQAVQFDPAKPPEERTLPGGFLERLVESLFVVVDNAVFPAPCFLDGLTVAKPLILRNCAFTLFSATATTFKAPINLNGSSFESCTFGHCELLEGNFHGIRVAQDCWFAYAHVHGYVDFSGATCAALVLAGATIDGELIAQDVTVGTFVAKGMAVKLDVTMTNAHFQNPINFSDVTVEGGVFALGAVFDGLFQPARVRVHGMFVVDRATFNGGVDVQNLQSATVSFCNAAITGNASFTDLTADNASFTGAAYGGALRFERGTVLGVFDIRRISVADDIVFDRTELQGGADIAGVEAATLQLLDVTCADIFAIYPIDLKLPNVADADVTRPSRFGEVRILRSKLQSLRPAQWNADVLSVRQSEVGYCLIEDTVVKSLVIDNTKFTEGCFVGKSTITEGVKLTNVTADGPVVFQDNTIARSITIILSRFGRLDFARQPLPEKLSCTSSVVTQLMFDETTRRHPLAEARGRYAGCTIDLESSTYDQIICTVGELVRSLAAKDSRQQFVVLERALRQSGFDELADAVYRSGRTRYYHRVKKDDFGVWLRGAIANWTTGYGLSVTRITVLTLAVPILVFFLLLLSPGSATEPAQPHGCVARPSMGTAAVAVGTIYINDASNVSEVRLTDCPLVGIMPARGVVLPLRILGLILIPMWFAIATGILKYAVKSGN